MLGGNFASELRGRVVRKALMAMKAELTESVEQGPTPSGTKQGAGPLEGLM